MKYLDLLLKKWREVHDQLGNVEDTYKPSKQIRFIKINAKTRSMFAYVVVKGTITVTNPDNNAYNKKIAFKNNASFISCILKINNILINNAKDLDIVMPM